MFRRLEILLICIALAVTLGLSFGAKKAADSAAERQFLKIASTGAQDLSARMSLYMQTLNGAAALINASDEVTAPDFERYVQTLDVQRNLPGINGVGFIVPIQRGEEEILMREVELNGGQRFNVFPDTDGPERFVIKYIYPRGINKEAFGLDISFEEGRKWAATESRETGEARLTPRILLVQDATKQPGFLLLRPVFDAPAGAAERGPFRGWVYAPFIGVNLLSNLSADEGRFYHLSVYDGAELAPENLIYDSSQPGEALGRFSDIHTMQLYGRTWTIQFSSTTDFDVVFKDSSAYLILVGGLLLTAMLAYLLRNMRLRSDALSEVAALRSRQVSAREDENRSIMENAVTPVFILDADNRVISANQAAVACFGYDSDQEMLGQLFEAFVTSVDLEEGVARHNATGRTRDGAHLQLDIQSNGWTTLNDVSRTTVIARDITAETKAVGEMQETKRRFDMALDGAEIGIFEVDLITGRSIVSETWCQIMGIDEAAAVLDTQQLFLSRVHPEDLPSLLASDKSCIEGSIDRSISEYRMSFGDDRWRWMKSDAVVIKRDSDGRALRMVGTQTDVTDVHHARNALETSEARFRLVLSEAPVGMAMTNERGEFIGVNEALGALCGRTQEQLLSGFRLQDLVPSDDLKQIYSAVNALMAEGSTEPYRGEHRIKHVNGSERWGLFNTSWAYDRNAKGNFFITQINDITDQKHLDQMKSEFVSTVSHELRTPLTSIKGALALLTASVKDELAPAGMRLLDIATGNVDRLTLIVNDILDLEKISSGSISYNNEDIRVREIVEASIREMSPFALKHKTTLRCDLPNLRLTIYADRGRMMQVMANLISNACKYSWDNTEVLVKVEQVGDLAVFYVQNVGPGVPESFKAQIFKAFSQADSSDTRAKGGTGLGLNISKQIVLRHGGKMGFESSPDGLTIFWFTVPVTMTEEESDAVHNGPVEQIDSRKLKVLHLEDDPDFAEVVRTGLEPFAQVKNVASVAKAREIIGKETIDIIILDWMLPDGDASELLDEIEIAHPQARMFSLSADADRKHDDRILKNIVKSKTDLSNIVETITTWREQAS